MLAQELRVRLVVETRRLDEALGHLLAADHQHQRAGDGGGGEPPGAVDHDDSSILEKTLTHTVDIYSTIFTQGRGEGSLVFSGTPENAAYAYFSYLVGAQIVSRVRGGVDAFNSATEVMIRSWEA